MDTFNFYQIYSWVENFSKFGGISILEKNYNHLRVLLNRLNKFEFNQL